MWPILDVYITERALLVVLYLIGYKVINNSLWDNNIATYVNQRHHSGRNKNNLANNRGSGLRSIVLFNVLLNNNATFIQ